MVDELITAKLEWAFIIEPVPLDSEYSAGSYNCVVWLKKEDPAAIKFRGQLDELINLAVVETWGKTPPAKLSIAKILDGDTEGYVNDEGESVYPNQGSFGFRVSSKRKPVVVDGHGSPIVDSSLLGYNPRAQIKLRPYSWSFGKSRKGVSLGLSAAMVVDFGQSTASTATEGFEFENASA